MRVDHKKESVEEAQDRAFVERCLALGLSIDRSYMLSRKASAMDMDRPSILPE